MCDLAPATLGDFVEVYGHLPPKTFQGYVARVKGHTALVCGLYRDEDRLVAFSRIRPGTPKRAIVMAARQLLALMQTKVGVEIYAIREEAIKTSGTLLAHLGFRHIADGPDGGIYQWRM